MNVDDWKEELASVEDAKAKRMTAAGNLIVIWLFATTIFLADGVAIAFITQTIAVTNFNRTVTETFIESTKKSLLIHTKTFQTYDFRTVLPRGTPQDNHRLIEGKEKETKIADASIQTSLHEVPPGTGMYC